MILVTGGTGFVGSHLVARLVQAGEQVRALARTRVEISGVEVVVGDVRDLSAVTAAVRDCQAVIHLVGIVREIGEATFQRVHVDGTRTVVQACVEAGVGRLLHMSALGARPGARSTYHRTKWEAEELVRRSGLQATIFRPSVIFGAGSGFLAELRRLVHRGPVIPIAGNGMALLQPIWVEDVISCFVGALAKPETAGQAYHLGGPEVFGFEEMVDLVAAAEGIRKPRLHLPVLWLRPLAAVLGRLTPRFPLTSDQLTMLLEDGVCDTTEMREVLAVNPASLREHLME
jgi:NADH dehydrogenase